jgi:phage repressor protein C with HTH and peptisase S24 domain
LLNKKEVGTRLKEWLLTKYNSIDEAGKALDTTGNSLRNSYLNGKALPGGELMQKLLEIGCPIDEILTGKRNVNSRYSLRKTIEASDIAAREKTLYKELRAFSLKPFPVIQKLAAGNMKQYFNDIPAEDLILVPYRHEHCIVMLVDGDSMSPLISDGDLVVVDLIKHYKNKDIVAVALTTGEQMIKRYKANDGENSIILYSDNPAYTPRIIGKNFIQNIYKVVKIIKDV